MGHADLQSHFRVRFDWGLNGAIVLAEGADIAVIVDILSFTTTVSVAMDAGTTVLPYRWNDELAQAYAAENNAVLAVGRTQQRVGTVSLSPATIREAEHLARLVLPSPNGSTIAHHLGASGARLLAASLRNARAVARWITAHYDAEYTTVAVIAAGERWPNGGLRPAVEDLWGAGAVIAGLRSAGWMHIAPEALAACAAHRAMLDDVPNALRGCVSGRELIDSGYETDVVIAAEVDISNLVPMLRDQQFVSAGAG